MHLDEGPVASVQPSKRIDGLDHARPFGPSAAYAASEGHHRNASRFEGIHADGTEVVGHTFRCIEHVVRVDVLDLSAHRQPVLGEADPAALQIRPDLLVLDSVKPVFVEQCLERLHAGFFFLRVRKQPIEQSLDHPGKLRNGAAGFSKSIQLSPANRRQPSLLHSQQ